MKFNLLSKNPDETELIGFNIGKKLKGGEVIELNSELGGGKTTFTHGLAKGIKSKDKVSSPTFTISKIYEGELIDIHHFDFYRLNDSDLIVHELADVLLNKKNVVVIEWPELVTNTLPEERLIINFIYSDDDVRNILFTYPESLSYLLGEYVDTNNPNR